MMRSNFFMFSDYHCLVRVIRCILVIDFWRLKPGFRCILSASDRKCEQNSAPESRRDSLYSVKIIKMSRLAINCLVILWSLHGCFVVAKQTVKHTTQLLLSLDTQDIERGQLWCAQNCTQNPCVFLTVHICSPDRVWIFCLCLTAITRIGPMRLKIFYWDWLKSHRLLLFGLQIFW